MRILDGTLHRLVTNLKVNFSDKSSAPACLRFLIQRKLAVGSVSGLDHAQKHDREMICRHFYRMQRFASGGHCNPCVVRSQWS